MTLEQWNSIGWLQAHKTSSQEISNILVLVERDLHDCHNDRISLDWRFHMAYNAGLQLAKAVLSASGYRVGKGESHHYRVIQSIPLVLGDAFSLYRDVFEVCRKKRNISEYDMAGTVSRKEFEELLQTVQKFREKVISWLREKIELTV